MPRPAVVRPKRVEDLAAHLGVHVRGVAEQPVTGITHDSRAVRPGDLYAALPGARAHGADFAAQAAAAGAVAVLTDPAGAATAGATGLPLLVVDSPRAVMGDLAALVHDRPGDALTLVGVTGTNGKTTSAYLLEGGLRAAGRATGLIGTVETRLGEEVVKSSHTTPEATDLQALFATMRERGIDAVAMEVSSHALVMGRVDGAVFDVAVFTNLSQDHLDFHAGMEDYFRAKAELFTPRRARRGVVNIDDAYGRRLVARATGAGLPVTTFSAAGDPAADWRATEVRTGPLGSTFVVLGPDGARAEGAVRLPGAFNVANALGAVVALVAAGVPLERAAAGVAATPGVPGRMERILAGQDWLAVVDFAHTPDAISSLLQALRPVTAGRLISVVGAGGDRDPAKRPHMGAAAVGGSDVTILTSDNPRSEDPLAILAALREGAEKALVGRAGGEAGPTVAELPAPGPDAPPDPPSAGALPAGAPLAEELPAEARSAPVLVQPDRAAAIATAVALAGPGDTVAVLGKGHERGQEIAGTIHPFDDREVLREAIARHRARLQAAAPQEPGQRPAPHHEESAQ
ncbi:UDP-N-acetylmuramoyl-L-alanyl-D-glutamate--2,6-diaminopimelate ligase [Allostreptomyces psammosilenae]|uniref:UDP-N-acetylmuramoyl-L-alanyl-D-glutamate--2,6-diaminopimelate ligase n=1 Tax=Allostreptomyces psammosilenae TaxID=1892865 RepID=A0A852ZXM6_9ACTN|nr:UDP-N-acetylmuramoyl-L-alanyl-D-glutamate--2,6-diaminopimelate ligase [Allostreptomyces psammosilenae]NYI07096.1 UDP-N-acetylmuramoyl-L-alanyl-D-glutamate--2,6-diaminopimelate ligase [Allostreptomyces psammosilenae]